MGVRQRAVVVVCLVTVVLVAWALAPAGAQLISLPGDSSTTTIARSTTTAQVSSTTTPKSSTTTRATSTTASSGPRPTTTAPPRSGASPSSTVRRATSTTTAGAGERGPTTSSTLRPTTTEPQGALKATTTTNPADLALREAASSSGMSTRSLVALIVAGLLAVALVLSVLTVRYVRATQPHDRFLA